MFSKDGSLYPNEYLLVFSARAGQANHFPWQIYACWIIMLLFSTASLTYHMMQRKLNVDKYSYNGRMKEWHIRAKQRKDQYLEQQSANMDNDDKSTQKLRSKYYTRADYKGALG